MYWIETTQTIGKHGEVAESPKTYFITHSLMHHGAWSRRNTTASVESAIYKAVDPNRYPKVFLDNFPMFANSVVSIHCIGWGLYRGPICKLSVQVPRIARWFPATARPSCCLSCCTCRLHLQRYVTYDSMLLREVIYMPHRSTTYT